MFAMFYSVYGFGGRRMWNLWGHGNLGPSHNFPTHCMNDLDQLTISFGLLLGHWSRDDNNTYF